jgi:hypothetical protein
LSLEELEKAGERFLSDEDWKDCKDNLTLKFNDRIHQRAKEYCEDHKMKMPDIHSFEDIKNKIPGYYKEKVEESQEDYRSALETRLLNPIGCDNRMIDDGDYKNKEEFKKWLATTFIAPELAISIHHLSDGTITSEKLTDYYFTYLDGGGMPETQDHINMRTWGDHGQAFMVLRKKLFNKDFKPAYYTIVW